MSINSINPNDPLYGLQATGATSTQQSSTSASSIAGASSEDALQSIDLGTDSFSLEALEKAQEHKEIMKKLQQELDSIRQQKQSLISQLAFAQDDEDRSSINSEIKELNKQSDSVYMDIIKEMQNYNNTLSE